MIYKAFQDIKLSCLGMGNMRLPGKAHPDEKGSIDWDESQKILDLAMASGINYYDTAHVYGNGESEACVGHCMKKHPRDSFYLATKFNINAESDYRRVFKEQLERLQTDRIDFYLIHCITDGNIDIYLKSGAIEFFEQMKEEGKITYLGFSSHASPKTLARFADHRAWDFAQIQLNYFDWLYSSTEEEYHILHDRNIPIVVMEPVRGGRLSSLTPETEAVLKAAHPDWSISSWALRFVRSLPGIQVILSGMSSLEQLNDNLNTFSTEESLSEEDKELLLRVCKDFKNQVQIPCTACRYCTSECPMQINIPEYLRVLNDYKVNGSGALGAYGKVDSVGEPKDCIACKACMGHCPQGIEIPTFMAELSALVD